MAGPRSEVAATDVDLLEVRRQLLASQAVFFAALLWCYAIEHGPKTAVNGISYFGVHVRTAGVLAIGYLAGGIGLWRTATYFVTRGRALAGAALRYAL